MSQDVREIALWSMGFVGTILFAILAFFLKRLIDQVDSRGKALHALRQDFQKLRSAVDLDIANLRAAIRIGFERMKIKYGDIEGLNEPPRLKDDSTETERMA